MKRKTRLDDIHKMSAEQLAKLIYKLDEEPQYCAANASADIAKCLNTDCTDCILRWLNEETE